MHRIPAWVLLSLVLIPSRAALAQPGDEPSAELYLVDPARSRVRIHLGRAGVLGFLGHDHEIDAPLEGGRIEVVDGDASRSLVDVWWSAASLAVVPGTEPADDVPEVEERMRGPEVLDVEGHSRIRLWSFGVDVEEADPEDGAWRLVLHAGLELKGTRHRLQLPVEVRRLGDELVARGAAQLRLRSVGVEPPSVAGVVKVSDAFRVVYEVRALRE